MGNNSTVAIFDTNHEGEKGRVPFLKVYIDAEKSLGTMRAISWLPHDNGILVTSHGNGKINIWDTSILGIAESIDLKGGPLHCHSICPSQSDSHNYVACGWDKGVKLVDLRTSASIREFKTYARVTSILWDPQSEFRLYCGLPGRIECWDIRKLQGCQFKSGFCTSADEVSIFPRKSQDGIMYMNWHGGNRIVSVTGLGYVELTEATPRMADPKVMQLEWRTDVGDEILPGFQPALLEDAGSGLICLPLHDELSFIDLVSGEECTSMKIEGGTPLDSLIYDYTRTTLFGLSMNPLDIYSFSLF